MTFLTKFFITDWFYFTLFCTNNAIDDLVVGERRTLQSSTLVGDGVE